VRPEGRAARTGKASFLSLQGRKARQKEQIKEW